MGFGSVSRMRFFKRLLFVLALGVTVSASASDQLLNSLQPRGVINDFANVISASEEQELNSMLTELRQKTGAAVVVVTLPSLDGGQIDDFTNRLFERWGVGQKGKDNGLMFLAAMQDRKMRIEVGYGLEGAIPDAVAGHIRRNVITPYFKAGNPGRGIVLGMAAVSQEIAQEYGVSLTGSARYAQQMPTERKRNPILSLLMLIIFAVFAIRHPFLALLLISGGRGGGYRGGGFGGGGGGFGGGMSGGGGSSGGW